MDEMNPANERLKHAWTKELQISKQERTIDQRLAALAQFERLTDFASFADFNRDVVDQYLEALRKTPTRMKTKAAKVRHVRSFFDWMVMEEHLRPKAVRKAILALRLTDKEARTGRATKATAFPTLAEIEATIRNMPEATSIDLRNRALLAFTALSGARDGAIVSMKVKHLRWDGRQVEQHPDEVETKAGKMIETWFFPVGEFLEGEVKRYLDHLKGDLEFSDDDPLFPAPQMGHDEADQFCAIGLSKDRWATPGPMRKIFRAAFESNGLKYFNPHSFRNMLVDLAYQRGLDPQSFKAWSQNLGHEHLDTTYNSYGKLDANAQRRAMMRLNEPEPDTPDLGKRMEAILERKFEEMMEGVGLSLSRSGGTPTTKPE